MKLAAGGGYVFLFVRAAPDCGNEHHLTPAKMYWTFDVGQHVAALVHNVLYTGDCIHETDHNLRTA